MLYFGQQSKNKNSSLEAACGSTTVVVQIRHKAVFVQGNRRVIVSFVNKTSLFFAGSTALIRFLSFRYWVIFNLYHESLHQAYTALGGFNHIGTPLSIESILLVDQHDVITPIAINL